MISVTGAGAFVILLVDENNNVLGNLPTGKADNLFEEEIDKLAGSYIGLDIFTEAFKDAYNKDNSKTDGLWVMPKVFSVIDNWMIGKIIYSEKYNTIETIFSSTDSTGNKTELSYQFAIGAVDRNGNVTLEMLQTYDLVGSPGFSQARLKLNENQIAESINESAIYYITEKENLTIEEIFAKFINLFYICICKLLIINKNLKL